MALAVWTDDTGVLVDGTGVLLSEDCCCGEEDVVECTVCCTDDIAPAQWIVTITGMFGTEPEADCCEDFNETFVLDYEGGCVWSTDGPTCDCFGLYGSFAGRVTLRIVSHDATHCRIEVLISGTSDPTISYNWTVYVSKVYSKPFDCCDLDDEVITGHAHTDILAVPCDVFEHARCDGTTGVLTATITALGC